MRRKKKKVQKVNTTHTFDSRLQAVCNQNWTIRPASGTQAEGVSRTTRHRLQFVGVVGLKPLSDMRIHWSHMQQAQKRLFSAEKPERQQCNAAGMTFAARVRPTGRRTP